MTHLTYVVASTPRSGSSLLAEGLEATGVVGRPAEYFAPDFTWLWKEHWQLSGDCSWGEYLARAMAYATTENGVRGIKIHWEQVLWLAGAIGVEGYPGDVLDALFPAGVFVNIVRADRRAQALSLFRAMVTDEWCRFPGSRTSAVDLSGVTPTYEQIAALERAMEWQQEGWEQHFAARRARVLTVRYEDLDADYRGEIRRVLVFLGADSRDADHVPAPRLQRQSDHFNLSWRHVVEGRERAAEIRA